MAALTRARLDLNGDSLLSFKEFLRPIAGDDMRVHVYACVICMCVCVCDMHVCIRVYSRALIFTPRVSSLSLSSLNSPQSKTKKALKRRLNVHPLSPK